MYFSIFVCVIYTLSYMCYFHEHVTFDFFLSLTKCWRIMQSAVSLCTAENSATQKLSIIIVVVIRNKTSQVALL